MQYLVIIEKTVTGYSGYSPDLPGCVASGVSAGEVRNLMREGIEFHIEGLRLGGFPVPPPSSEAVFFTVSDSGEIQSEIVAETLYDIKTFATKAGVSPSTVRVYAHRYHIGRKMGRGWVFTEKDLSRVPAWV
jgi:predicted RNase H-like HicB family nuclease